MYGWVFVNTFVYGWVFLIHLCSKGFLNAFVNEWVFLMHLCTDGFHGFSKCICIRMGFLVSLTLVMPKSLYLRSLYKFSLNKRPTSYERL